MMVISQLPFSTVIYTSILTMEEKCLTGIVSNSLKIDTFRTFLFKSCLYQLFWGSRDSTCLTNDTHLILLAMLWGKEAQGHPTDLYRHKSTTPRIKPCPPPRSHADSWLWQQGSNSPFLYCMPNHIKPCPRGTPNSGSTVSPLQPYFLSYDFWQTSSAKQNQIEPVPNGGCMHVPEVTEMTFFFS